MGYLLVRLGDLGSEAASCLVANLCSDVFEETVVPHSQSGHSRPSVESNKEREKNRTICDCSLFHGAHMASK